MYTYNSTCLRELSKTKKSRLCEKKKKRLTDNIDTAWKHEFCDLVQRIEPAWVENAQEGALRMEKRLTCKSN